ncbi:Integrase catalytic core protein [Phytophthora cinnamomi]|uniref:Integrase catalytic core protein n=1 Tax=Phytophthora cinnamomi TaxID=4785 RepID=UPI00355AA268|nr:Integrase catalytic core protein [Phytophthora cinnamomi]
MSSVKLIVGLARKWRVPAKHGDVPNAYVKADKEPELVIYIRLPQGMAISEDIKKKLGVASDDDLVLELKKALYGLKQAGRLWSKMLQRKLLALGFEQSITDMCVYYSEGPGRREQIPWYACHVEGYHLDQEAAIEDLLREFGMEAAHAIRTPIGMEWNENDMTEALPMSGGVGVVTVGRFHSLVGSLLWISRCTRPDKSFAVHKATRKTHNPSMSDWKLAKRILKYLAGTKELRFQMKGNRGVEEALEVIAYSDADFAADKTDRKSVTGGLVTLDGMPVCWVCKKQGGVALSTMEAEYTAASVMAAELLGIRELLENFGQVFSGFFKGDKVAVKKLPPETHENDDHVDSFVAEVKIIVTLNQSKKPTLWVAPEVIRDEMYSTDADMFWFSVVLSELDMSSALYAQARQQICDSSWCPLQQADILQEVTMGSLRF